MRAGQPVAARCRCVFWIEINISSNLALLREDQLLPRRSDQLTQKTATSLKQKIEASKVQSHSRGFLKWVLKNTRKILPVYPIVPLWSGFPGQKNYFKHGQTPQSGWHPHKRTTHVGGDCECLASALLHQDHFPGNGEHTIPTIYGDVDHQKQVLILILLTGSVFARGGPINSACFCSKKSYATTLGCAAIAPFPTKTNHRPAVQVVTQLPGACAVTIR